MNKWYKKTTAKAVIFLLAVLSGAAFVTSLIGALTIAGTANPRNCGICRIRRLKIRMISMRWWKIP